LQQKAQDETGEAWEVINIPAICETETDVLGRKHGEALWPERYDEEALEKIRKAVGTRVWNALFQQRPSPLEGGLFKRFWFAGKLVEPSEVPAGRACRGWDLAATEKQTGNDPDYAAGVKMVKSGDRIYVTHVDRFREGPDKVEKRVRLNAELDGIGCEVVIEQEPGASGKIVINHYTKRILKGFKAKGVPPSGDKVTRATPFAAACERGDVFIVNGAWTQDYIDELCTFPNAAHDDQVDASANAFNKLNKRIVGWTGATE
jgi:predicted phage terminase large subunit-like protein